jgi:general secretion pathway protein L
MSVLVLIIPARPRLGAPAAEERSNEYTFVLSPDGLSAGKQGRAAASLLPRADSVVAVLADSDVSWHRITLPKAPATRLRAALVGVLEEALLDEPETLHLALSPGAVAGQPAWVAVVHKGWLAGHLATLEKAHVTIDRVVPSSWPDEMPLGHFSESEGTPGSASMRLTWSDANGVVTLGVQGTLARTLLPQWQERAARWSATPAVAAPAERWLGAPVLVLGADQRALQASRSLWNLRQFDLSPRHRGAQAMRDFRRRFMSPAFRPIRIGLAALVVLQVLGLNLWAWHQRSAIAERRAQMSSLLMAAFPETRSVLDAPTQMQRATDALRASAGRPGETDLETLLGAAAAAWPEGRPPAESLRFDNGRLTVSSAGWSPEQIEQFRGKLRPTGWDVDVSSEGSLTLRRAQGTPS